MNEEGKKKKEGNKKGKKEKILCHKYSIKAFLKLSF